MKFSVYCSFAILFLVGFFRGVKMCSKADDLAHTGSYVRNLDNVQYTRSYKNVGAYTAVLNGSDNVATAEKIARAENAADEILFAEIKAKHPELKNQIETLNQLENPIQKTIYSRNFKSEYLSSEDLLKFENLSKTIKFVLDIKEFYQLEGTAESKENKTLSENKIYKAAPFQINIPAGFVEVTTLLHPQLFGVWSNGNVEIYAYPIAKTKQEAIAKRRAFKKSDKRILLSEKDEPTTSEYTIVSKHEVRFGKMKIIQENGKFVIIEVEYKGQSECKSEADNLLRVL